MKLKVASTFAGCGGLDFAFHQDVENFEMVYVMILIKIRAIHTRGISILRLYAKTYVKFDNPRL